MGIIARLRLALRATRPTTDFTYAPVDTYMTAVRGAGWSVGVSRETALQVPAVLRGRNLICAISTLPLVQRGPNRAQQRSVLLAQIDPQVPNVVMMAQTVEDLLFDGIAWWQILARDAYGFPASAQHIDVARVHLDPPPGGQSLNLLPSGADPSAAVWIDTKVVPGRDVIRFDSPNPPLLVAGRRAIRRAALLEQTSERYAKNPRPLDYFTAGEGADPASDDEISDILYLWGKAREESSTGYIPLSLEYHSVASPSPSDLQLVQLQARAALDLANALGLDPEDLGVSTTSRTYQNATDRRQDRINDVLAPYMRAVADRLSMNDVTRRGYTVGFDLSDYLKADPITRATVATQYHALGAITVDEIREDDGRPMLTETQKGELVPKSNPATVNEPVKNSAPISVEFDDGDGEPFSVHFDAPVSFSASKEKRTIGGEILLYGPVGKNWHGSWRFAAGSVFWNSSAVSRVKLNREHIRSSLVGAATEVRSSDDGLTAKFKVGRTPSGDEVLALAEDGILDGFSAEVDILKYQIDPTDADVFLVTSAELTGVAITSSPAFRDARVTSVAALTKEGNTVPNPLPPITPPTPVAPPAPEPVPAQFSAEAMAAAVQAGVQAALSELGPTTVNPRREPTIQVTRAELPYGFNGHRRPHDFSTDLFASAKGDGVARERLDKFLPMVFGDDVSTGDVDELNPTRNRPDLFVDNLEFATPVWTAINKGAIADSTPFTIPMFGTATTVVSAHVEGTEPTAGVYTTTSGTVTPSAVSGKFELTREVIDQGGNPQVSTIIWAEIIRSYNEGLEVAAVAMLDALTPTGIALNGTDADLDQDLTANFALLQYIRGGNRFSRFFLASDLFSALAAAVDDNGRRLYPVIAPSNSSGQTSADGAYIQVNGLQARPAWALEAGNGGDGSSYLFSPNDCHGWATAPRRLNLEYQVKSVELGVFGYLAVANTRLTGVREVTYTV